MTLSEAADELGCAPKKLSALIYGRRIDVARTKRLGNLRLIERSYVPEIRKMLGIKRKPGRPRKTALRKS